MVGEVAAAQVTPSVEVTTVPRSPAATNGPATEGDALERGACTPLVAGFQLFPSGEVAMTPPAPTVTQPLGRGATAKRSGWTVSGSARSRPDAATRSAPTIGRARLGAASLPEGDRHRREQEREGDEVRGDSSSPSATTTNTTKTVSAMASCMSFSW